MKTIALIPARGGSKGIKRKNIKLLDGLPLIAYTIRASLSSKKIDRTIVSTDDEEIAKIAKEYYAEVPFLRPKKLSLDTTLDYPVIKHCLDYLINKEKWKPDIFLYLRPTMPFRESSEIDKSIDILSKKEKIDCIRTTMPVPYPPYWMKRINQNGHLEPFHESIEKFTKSRRQNLPKVVICDGYVDACKVSALFKYKEFPPGRQFALFRENKRFVDIDTMSDWEYCEYLLSRKKSGK